MKVYTKKDYCSNPVIKEYCCKQLEDLFDGDITTSEGSGKPYIEYTDWSFECGFLYPIEFRYCPYCGEKIEFIY